MPEGSILLVAIGLVAGIMGGMFGIGGGIVIVPGLIILAGFEHLDAVSVSLTARLVPVGILAAIAYYNAGKLQIKTAILIVIGLTVGAALGAPIAISLPQDTLKQIYGIFLLYVAWRFIDPIMLFRNYFSDAPPVEKSKEEEIVESPEVGWYVLLLVGFIAGIAVGLFGIGGGVVIVPALITILKFDLRRATGTSLAALQFPAALPAVIQYANDGHFDLAAAVLVGIGLIIGFFIGARTALNLPGKTVKRLYAIFLIFVAIRFLFGL